MTRLLHPDPADPVAIALPLIAVRDSVRKFGHVIGRATRDIAAGEHVHVHNSCLNSPLPNACAPKMSIDRSRAPAKPKGSDTSVRQSIYAALLTCLATPAVAQEQDQQLWIKLAAGTDLNETTDLGFEMNQRVSNDEGDIIESQYLAKIGVDIGDGFTLTGGINRVVGVSDRRIDNTEWRPRQEIGFPSAKIGGGDFGGRIRLEQRFRSDGDDVGHRVRPEITYTLPLSETFELEVGHESYFNLNTTDFGHRSGYERMRNFATLGFPVTQNVSASVGYLNQYRFNRRARDRMEHALITGLSVKL